MKHLGHLPLPLPTSIYVPNRTKALGLRELPITQVHALASGSLPETHGDPFDRILVAQAQIESMTLVTRDARIISYPVKTLFA